MEKKLPLNPKNKMRKMTKNEKILLMLLGIVILFWAVFRFIIVPQKNKLDVLSQQKDEYKDRIVEINKIFKKEDQINKDLEMLHKERDQILGRYFSKLDQPQIIYLLNDLIEDDKLSVADINFSRPSEEKIEEMVVNYMDVSIPFKGEYEGVMNVVEAINKSPRKILVDGLTMDKGEIDQLSGNLSLKIYSLEGISNGIDNIASIADTVESIERETPFSPYKDYSGKTIIDNSEEIFDREENMNDYSEEIRGGISESKDHASETLIDFENESFHFIPSHPLVKGSVGQSTVAKSKKSSLRFEYNILALEEENRAYVDLSKNDVEIKYPPNSIGIWVYAYGYSPGTLGIRFKGQVGEMLDVELSKGVSWIGWQYIEIVPPADLSLYPLKLDKIYLEISYNREDYGVLLFDKLEAYYPANKNLDKSFYSFYIVEKGDTIEKISMKLFGNQDYRKKIMKINDIKQGDILNEGKILVLPRK